MILTLLQAGVAALNVGAIDAGLDNLRRAASLAETSAGHRLQAKTLTELGGALFHSVIEMRQFERLVVAFSDKG